jgi:hypothetical protein
VRSVGPLIAVRQPGEELSQLGAARIQLPDAGWKAKVSDLMTHRKRIRVSDHFLWATRTKSKQDPLNRFSLSEIAQKCLHLVGLLCEPWISRRVVTKVPRAKRAVSHICTQRPAIGKFWRSMTPTRAITQLRQLAKARCTSGPKTNRRFAAAHSRPGRFRSPTRSHYSSLVLLAHSTSAAAKQLDAIRHCRILTFHAQLHRDKADLTLGCGISVR